MSIYILLVIMMLVIIGCSIAYPRRRLISWQLVVGTLAGSAIFFAAVLLWRKYYASFRRLSFLYWICLLGLGVALFAVSLNRLGNTRALIDYMQVYSAAVDMALGKEPENAYYFHIYSNNYQPALLLSALFQVADILHVSREHFVLLISIFQVLLTVWACGFLTEKDGCKMWRFPILVAFAAFLPLWGMTSAFYTDTMSFGLGVQALAWGRFSRQLKRENCVGRMLLWLFAGVCVALGMAWKITTVTMLLAYVMVLCWQKAWTRDSIKNGGAILIAAIACTLGLNVWTDSHALAQEAEKTSNPVISWVALGMGDDGAYSTNYEFGYALNALETREQKETFSVQYIQEHMKECFSLEHFVKKLCRNYADGYTGVDDFFYCDIDDETMMWDLFGAYGKYYWRTSQYCFCYIAVIYVSFLLGLLCCLKRLKRGEELPLMLMVCQLAFAGMFCFLMVWEANNRQLYNQMPYFVVGAMMSMALFAADMRACFTRQNK